MMRFMNLSGMLEQQLRDTDLVKYATREEWLASRLERIGASQVPDLFGVGYGSMYELWCSFVLQEPQETEEDPWENEHLEWGNRVQDAILGGVSDREGWRVAPWPQTWRVNHKWLPLTSTPDALAWDEDGCIQVEVKNVSEWARLRWSKDDDGRPIIPARFKVQLQAQLACSGIHRGALALFTGGNRLEVLRYDWHAGFQKRLNQVIREFWTLVEAKAPPEPDGSESARRALFAQYPEADGTAVDLPAEWDDLANEWQQLAKSIKEDKQRLDAIKQKLQLAMADSTWAVSPGGKAFSNKEQQRVGVDAAKLQEKFPEAYQECQKVSQFRVARQVKSVPTDVEWADE